MKNGLQYEIRRTNKSFLEEEKEGTRSRQAPQILTTTEALHAVKKNINTYSKFITFTNAVPNITKNTEDKKIIKCEAALLFLPHHLRFLHHN